MLRDADADGSDGGNDCDEEQPPTFDDGLQQDEAEEATDAPAAAKPDNTCEPVMLRKPASAIDVAKKPAMS
eukprot:4220039-Alexandrium_andersonii.AAC.1